MEKPFVRLENWAVVEEKLALRYEELKPGERLMGNILGDARAPDGTLIYTSIILRVDIPNGVVETRNTLYHLGKTSEAYKHWEQEHRHQQVAA
jgi:hypothetical protein